MTTEPHAPNRRRQRRRTYLLLDLLIGAVALAIVVSVVLLVREATEEEETMTGPGTYQDAQGQITFTIGDGWQVIHDGDNTRIEYDDTTLPPFTVEIRQDDEMNLVVNWNCYRLRERIPFIAQAVGPAEATLTYSTVPCADDITLPTYGRMYFQLNDGSEQVVLVVFGPAGGPKWIVARTGPLVGNPSPSLVDAMTSLVISVRTVPEK